MDKSRVYIETTIPIAYHDSRSASEMVARRTWTRRWWNEQRNEYNLVTGPSVHEELMAGPESRRHHWVELLSGVQILDVEPAIREIVGGVREAQADAWPDAVHLALASFHHCDFLLTWNFKHLANRNKFRHIRRVNATLGLFAPVMVSPLELQGEKEEEL